MVDSGALDAQGLVTVDASTLQGLLILRTTEVRVWRGGLPGAAWAGYPGHVFMGQRRSIRTRS